MISTRAKAPVKAGDYLRIGPLTFQLQIDGQPEKTVPPQDNGEKTSPDEPILTAADDEEDDFLDLDMDEDMDLDLDMGDSGASFDELEEL